MMKQDKKVVLLSEEPENVEKPRRAVVSRVAPAWQVGSGEELEIPACVPGEVAEWSRQHNPITCQSPVHLSAASQQPDGLPPDPAKQELLRMKNATNTRAGWCRAGGRELLVKSEVMWLLKPCSVKVKREALWRPLGERSCSSGRPEDLNGAEPKSPSRASGYRKQPPCSENPSLSRAGFSPKRVLSRPQRCHMGRGPADDPLTATSQTRDTPQAFPQAHVTVHTGESGISRRQCEITQKHLRGHKKNNAEARTHSCVVCEDSFSSPGELKDHQRVHFGQKLLSCTECSKMFTTVKYLKVHERCHSGTRPFSCDTCGKGFVTPYSLKIHGRSHTGEKPFGCQQCGKCFSHISNLHKHRRIHTGEKRFMCEMCGRSFTQLSQLTKHQRSHAEKPPRRPGAKRAWTRRPRSQTQTQAAARAAHSCPTCGKSYKSKSALTLHVKLHTGVRLFQCQECEKSFTAQWALTEHMRTHSDDRPYKCEDCGKSFSRVSGVQKHKRTHAGEKPYGCPECGKAFSSSQTLRSHRLAHVEEESPHRCTQCGKGFVTRGNLKKHMLIHSGEKAHRCGQCAMSFIERSTLRIHQRIHTGEKPFSCDHCGKSFSQKSNLKKHTLTHTARTRPPLSAKHAVSAEQ